MSVCVMVDAPDKSTNLRSFLVSLCEFCLSPSPMLCFICLSHSSPTHSVLVIYIYTHRIYILYIYICVCVCVCVGEQCGE